MELGLGREACAAPARERGGLLLGAVHRPRKRQRQILEASEQHPCTVALEPERGQRATVAHESEVVAVGHVVSVDAEPGDADEVLVELVVPTERDAAAPRTERGGAGRDGDRVGARGRDVTVLRARPALLAAAEPVDDVHQRFVMHRFVLDDVVRGFGVDEVGVRRVVEPAGGERLDHGGVAGGTEALHRRTIRPGRTLVLGRHRHVARVDAAIEQPLQFGIDRRPAERVAHQRDERERRDVPVVEDEGVTQRDRRVFVCFRGDQPEELGRAAAVRAIA